MKPKSKPALRALRRTIRDAVAHGESGCSVRNDDPEILADLEDWCLDEGYAVRTSPSFEGQFDARWRY